MSLLSAFSQMTGILSGYLARIRSASLLRRSCARRRRRSRAARRGVGGRFAAPGAAGAPPRPRRARAGFWRGRKRPRGLPKTRGSRRPVPPGPAEIARERRGTHQRVVELKAHGVRWWPRLRPGGIMFEHGGQCPSTERSLCAPAAEISLVQRRRAASATPSHELAHACDESGPPSRRHLTQPQIWNRSSSRMASAVCWRSSADGRRTRPDVGMAQTWPPASGRSSDLGTRA